MEKTQTPVVVIARYQLKSNADQVFYKVRSSAGDAEYCVTCLDGIAVECDCPARKPCKHMKACTYMEASRNHTEQEVMMPFQPLVETHRTETVEKTAISTQTSDTPATPLQGHKSVIVARNNVSTAELSLSAFGLMRRQNERKGGWMAGAGRR